MTIFQICVVAPVIYYQLAVKHHHDAIIRSCKKHVNIPFKFKDAPPVYGKIFTSYAYG